MLKSFINFSTFTIVPGRKEKSDTKIITHKMFYSHLVLQIKHKFPVTDQRQRITELLTQDNVKNIKSLFLSIL